MQQKLKDISKEDSKLFRQVVGAIETMQHGVVCFAPSRLTATPRKKTTSKSLSYNRSDAPPSVGLSDSIYFKRNGVQEKIMRKLSTGRITIQAELDLHGDTVSVAKKNLDNFLTNCHAKKYRYIRVIHGKGYGSTNGIPILKNKINQWLREYGMVLAFCSAPPNHGGMGAVQILVRKQILFNANYNLNQ